jgi:hypothetical protein
MTSALSLLTASAALSEHPDFQAGIAAAREWFLENYEPAPLTEDEMIEAVEMELSRPVVEMSRIVRRMYGDKPSSYFYHLGFVFGTINEGLTYAG